MVLETLIVQASNQLDPSLIASSAAAASHLCEPAQVQSSKLDAQSMKDKEKDLETLRIKASDPTSPHTSLRISSVSPSGNCYILVIRPQPQPQEIWGGK